MKVLIVDDDAVNRILLVKALAHDYQTIEAANGAEAVALFPVVLPDVILMDAKMPVMDGYEATRRIRAIAPERWVPVIFVSALGESVDMVRGLEAGADDYLTKPIDMALLHAKMRAMQRIAALQLRLREQQAWQEMEQDMAGDLMRRMVGPQAAQAEVTSWMGNGLPGQRPFSGDLILCVNVQSSAQPASKLVVLHADSMGHGLVAAMPLLTLAELFSRMARSGASLANIAAALNELLYQRMPRGRFVAASLLAIDPALRRVDYWLGGMPPLLMFDGQGRLCSEARSQHMALGVFAPKRFSQVTGSWQCPDGGAWRIATHTDGLTDVRNAQGQSLGLARALPLLAGNLATLQETVAAYMCPQGWQDDISVFRYDFPAR